MREESKLGLKFPPRNIEEPKIKRNGEYR